MHPPYTATKTRSYSAEKEKAPGLQYGNSMPWFAAKSPSDISIGYRNIVALSRLYGVKKLFLTG
jgi:hypothetical protein